MPKRTSLAPEKLVPVIVTLLPPAGRPDAGDSDTTAGGEIDDAVYVKSLLEIAVPLGVTT